MHELILFLRARLDEDEQIAQDADEQSAWRAGTDVGDEYNVAVVTTQTGQPVARCGVEYLENGEGRAEHIARHDPVRVLAEVEAKRRIIELHELVFVGHTNHRGEPVSDPYGCRICDDWDGMILPGGPCSTLLLLALPWRDHPDFRSAWRPADPDGETPDAP